MASQLCFAGVLTNCSNGIWVFYDGHSAGRGFGPRLVLDCASFIIVA